MSAITTRDVPVGDVTFHLSTSGDPAKPPVLWLHGSVDYRATSWPGARLPHVWLCDGTSIYDRLSDGFTLLRVGADAPPSEAIQEAAAKAGLPLTVLDLEADEVGRTWDGVPLVLVRPDQHIAWRSHHEPSPEEANKVIQTVTGHA